MDKRIDESNLYRYQAEEENRRGCASTLLINCVPSGNYSLISCFRKFRLILSKLLVASMTGSSILVP